MAEYRLMWEIDIEAETPTTEGIIARLSREVLSGRRIGVQLYGTEPNRPLQDFLQQAGALCLPVAPYVYANASADRIKAFPLAEFMAIRPCLGPK